MSFIWNIMKGSLFKHTVVLWSVTMHVSNELYITLHTRKLSTKKLFLHFFPKITIQETLQATKQQKTMENYKVTIFMKQYCHIALPLKHYFTWHVSKSSKSKANTKELFCDDGTPTGLVCQQIHQSTQFLWDGTGSHNSAWDIFILHDHPAVGRLPHVQVYTQATHCERINK